MVTAKAERGVLFAVVGGVLWIVGAGAPACHEEERVIEREPSPTVDGGNSDGAGDGVAFQPATCTFPAPINTPPETPCPVGCTPILGSQRDVETPCVRQVLVGCISCAHGCGGAPEGYCAKSLKDGRVVEVGSYVMQNLPNRSDWEPCTQSDEDRMKVPLCQ